ncbi:class I SAM-dependent methyltransferase [Campylobacter cuniculorum]|uniref:Methyltransferase domain-containing protein n=2 Tax=Campylobacter cuniculorum TaxID=374106 RepID=A0ABX6U1Z7_9BACT|nr:methyltransferase domain-containing protein [Campylobacter cuniculorum]QOR03878.1 methyltransferase domain-containing protein [Campylobacter cuniculorum]
MQKINYLERKQCVINQSELEIISKEKFPLFCGCTEKESDKDLICEEEIAISKEGVLQLKKLIPLDLLYKNGHDAGAIGALWEEHHKEFANFIMQNHPKNILEIGGGHGKLSQNCLEINPELKYTIIEPNSTKKHNNINYIDSFFKKENIEQNFDCIVHSHTFEHIYKPLDFLQDCFEVLTGGGIMIFSLPNLQKSLELKSANCLCFEHTIFLNENVLEFILSKSGFKILDKKYFKEHSIFYKVIKDKNAPYIQLKNEYEKNKKLFLDYKEYYKNRVKKLNEILKNTNASFYLFGAHLFSQVLIYNGLELSKIKGILDNNPNKWDKRLYGTPLFVKNPQILKNQNNSFIILSPSIYNEEIKAGLMNITAKINFLE